MLNVLISGVHGFVGSNLVEAFKSVHTVYGLDIISPEKDGIEHTFDWTALNDLAALKLHAIIHLAAIAHDIKNQTLAQEFLDVNLGLTQKIFDFFLASDIKEFIFFSTVKAAADKVESDVQTEDVVPSPKGPYGESKLAAENYILSKRADWEAKGKEVYILRPCMIHGPGNKGNLNLLYNVIRKGIPWPLGSFENRRTYTSDNLSFVVNALLTKPVASGIYNMSDDEAISTNELIEIICGILDKKAHIWHLPKGLMNGLAKVGGWLHLPLNPDRFRKLTENYVASNAKLKAALGIEQMPVPAKEGLQRTIKNYLHTDN